MGNVGKCHRGKFSGLFQCCVKTNLLHTVVCPTVTFIIHVRIYCSISIPLRDTRTSIFSAEKCIVTAKFFHVTYITWIILFPFTQCRDLCLIVGYTFVNGDVSNLPAAGVTFPPTPESPSTMQITATSTPDYTSLNGAPMPNEILFSGSEAGAYH